MSRTRSPSTPARAASAPTQRSADSAPETLEYRTLILAPEGADGAQTKAILDKAGLVGLICPDAEALVHDAEVAAGALLVTEEAVEGETRPVLSDLLARQPSWSDLPVLVLTRPGNATSLDADEAGKHFGNVTLLERPVPVATVVSTLRAALRARERQYELRGRMQAQSLLAAIVESSDDAITSKTLEGIIVSWNAGAQALFGYTAEEAVGQPITLLFPPDRWDEERDILSRITRGETELRRERIEVAVVIGSAIETSKPLIDTAGHELVLSIPDEELCVDADPVRLSQVFANLLNNAAKYSEPGGRIWLSARREDAHVVVFVRDAGIGIAQDMLPRVFEMFAQEAGAMSRSQGGLGIGLTLVQNIVQMHGGSVEAHSAGRGKGSEFIVWLPLVTHEREAAHDERGALGHEDRARIPTPHASA